MIVVRVLAVVVLLPICAVPAQTPRFRYDLVDDPSLPVDVRRTIDSMNAVDDSVYGCLSRADTLWVVDFSAPIPARWLEASLRQGCGFAALPNPVRRRLRDDPASLRYYEQVFRARNSSPAERSKALLLLSWSADPRYLPLLIRAASEQRPAMLTAGDYNASYNAIIALAPYLSSSREARRLVERAAADPQSMVAREAGMLSLAAANDPQSRQTMQSLPLASVSEYVRDRVAHSLAHAPCTRGLIFVVWMGVEGQDYSKCELPPDYR